MKDHIYNLEISMPKLRWVNFKNEEEPLLSLQDLIEQG